MELLALTVRQVVARTSDRSACQSHHVQRRFLSGPGVYLEKPVSPSSYVSAVLRLLGMETPAETEPAELRNELAKALSGADRETLQRALDALKRK